MDGSITAFSGLKASLGMFALANVARDGDYVITIQMKLGQAKFDWERGAIFSPTDALHLNASEHPQLL
jgi:hypothetical protein